MDRPNRLERVYLPAGDQAGTLDANLIDPTTTVAGSFGGNVAGLKLNVDYNDAGVLSPTASVMFGDLTVCGLTSDTDLNGMTGHRQHDHWRRN
jgi:hypothetical protein